MELISFLVLFFLYLALFIACFWVIVLLDNLDTIWDDPKAKRKYSISVLIPAYNEESSIENTIMSALSQNYPKKLFEVIVVNDGSTDSTREKCEYFEKKGLIKLINKKNGGKATALNLGIKKAKGELVYILDADSYADKNSFNKLIGYFDNTKVAAVTSSMKVVSKDNILQKIQWVEYLFSAMMRKIMSLFNSLYVTPGPGSVYRKSVILEIGGFSEKTLTEDMEIAFHIQDKGYRIENSLNSLVLTKTPDKLYNLIKQRRRWYTGFMEDSYSYKHFFFNKEKGFLGRFLLPANVVSTFSLLFLTFYALYSVFKSALAVFSNFKSIDFEIFSMLSFPNLSILFYGINVFSVLGVIFLVFSLVMIFYSIKTSGEKMNVFKNFFDYLSYLIFYSLIMSLFWTDSIIYKIFLRRKKEGWYYGKKEALN